MRGYPKHIATKQDYENIIKNQSLWKAKALVELKAIKNLKDDKVKIATTLKDENKPDLGYNLIELDNPLPKYKQLGFLSHLELDKLIESAGNEIKEEK